MRNQNQQLWNSTPAVDVYRFDTALQKPEQTILELFKNRLKAWDMLDIGIGVGRTTRYFAPLAKSYVGNDYSEKMIETCKQYFPNGAPQTRIQLGDARAMPEFDDAAFDFILFSFNGIDYLAHDERAKALQEIQRVGKPGGYFVFSTHNIRYVNRMYTIKSNNSLRYFAYQCYRFARLIVENGLPGKFRDADWAVLVDDAHHFRYKTYYIDPAYQIAQLNKLGFKNIRAFSLKTGLELNHQDLKQTDQDSWIYFVCEFP